MRKKYAWVLVPILVLILSLTLVACSNEESITYSDWEIVNLPTETSEGSIKRTGSDGKEYTFTLPVINDKNYTEKISLKPTCEDDGIKTYTIMVIDKKFSFDVKINKLGHDYSEPTYTWTDVSKCVATRVCKNDSTHIETATATIKSEIKDASFDGNGEIKYTATFDEDWAKTQIKIVVTDEQYTITFVEGKDATCTKDGLKGYYKGSNGVNYEDENHTKIIDNLDTWRVIKAFGHDFNATTYEWSTDLKSCTAKRICKNDSTHIETVKATIKTETKNVSFEGNGEIKYTATFDEDWAKTQIKIVVTDEQYTITFVEGKDATCTDDGLKGYYKGSNGVNYEDENRTKIIDNLDTWRVIKAFGHDFNATTYEWSDDLKACTAKRICKNDSTHIETANAIVTNSIKENATCMKKGTTLYTATFDVDWAENQTIERVDIEIDSTAHKFNATIYTWNDTYTECIAKRVCSYNNDHVETATSTNISIIVDTDPTLTAKGKVKYYANFADDKKWAEKDAYVIVEDLPILNTTDYNLTINSEPTYDNYGNGTYTITLLKQELTINGNVEKLSRLNIYVNGVLQDKTIDYIKIEGTTIGELEKIIALSNDGFVGYKVYSEETLLNEITDINKATKGNRDVTIYVAKKYNLHYETNGGQTVEDKIIQYGDLYVSPSTTKAGFHLDGWYTENEAGTFININQDKVIPSNHTIYANWIEDGFVISIITGSDPKAQVKEYTGTSISPIIPSIYQGYVVRNISANSFKNNTTMLNLFIPKNITYINERAFLTCSNIETIKVDENNKNYFSINNALYRISEDYENCYDLIRGCKNTIIPDVSKSICIKGTSFLNVRGLTSITFPKNVITISNTFQGNEDLTEITVNTKPDIFTVGMFYNLPNLQTISLPLPELNLTDGSKFTVSHLFTNEEEIVTDIKAPETINITSGTVIDTFDFYKLKGTTNINICEGITKIEYQAFSYLYNIEHLIFPKSIEMLNSEFDFVLNSLKWIMVYDTTSVTNCGLAPNVEYNVYVRKSNPNSTWTYGDNNIQVSSRDIYKSIQFYYYNDQPCNIIDERLSGYWKFVGNVPTPIIDSIEYKTLPFEDGYAITSYIGSELSVNIPSTCQNKPVIKLGDELFMNKKITSINMPKTIREIGNQVFMNCTDLQSIMLSKNIVNIGSWAFKGCTSIKIYSAFAEQPLTWENDFNPDNCLLYIYSEVKPEIIDSTIAGYFYYDESGKIVIYNDEYLHVEVVKEKGYVQIIGYTGKDTILKLPTIYRNLPLKIIGKNAFKNNKRLTKIDFNNNDFEIMEDAFNGCSSLTTLITAGDTKINLRALRNSAINYLEVTCNTLNKTIYDVDSENIITLSIKASGANNSFNINTQNWPNLNSIIIDDKLDNITYESVNNWNKIQSIEIDKNNPYYTSINNNIVRKDKKELVVANSNNEIPEDVTTIGKYAFKEHNLTNITIPTNITRIEDSAFYGCENLTHVTIGQQVNYVGKEVFMSCHSIVEINVLIDKAYVDIKWHESWAFSVSAEKIKYTNSSVTFGDYKYLPIDENSVYIIEYLGTETNITVPDTIDNKNVVSIENAFSDNLSIINITIGKNIKKIEKDAFKNCTSLESINIPYVEVIEENAFFGCTNLKNIDITNLITLNSSAFVNCSNLTNINFGSKINSIDMTAFNGTNVLDLVIPNTVKNIYSSDINCNSKTMRSVKFDKGSTIKQIPSDTFRLMPSLESVVLPDSLEELLSVQFLQTKINNLVIPASVKLINTTALTDIPSLTNLSVDPNNRYYSSRNGEIEINGIYYINDETQSYKGEFEVYYTQKKGDLILALPTITLNSLPESIKNIGSLCFGWQKDLTTLNIPEGIVSIEPSAFIHCNNLTTLNLPNSLKLINDKAFRNMDSLTKIVVPEGVNYIGSDLKNSELDVYLLTNTLKSGYSTNNNNLYLYSEERIVDNLPLGVKGYWHDKNNPTIWV